MPTYAYHCDVCEEDFDRMVSIDERDAQCCRSCGTKLHKKVAFNGLTWAPTAGGYR